MGSTESTGASAVLFVVMMMGNEMKLDSSRGQGTNNSVFAAAVVVVKLEN